MATYHRSVVISFIEEGCKRFGITFQSSFHDLRKQYQCASYDDLARLAFLAISAPGDALTEIEIKEQFIEGCKALGLE